MFCQLFPPLIYGGGETLFWNLAQSLASRDHEIHVITQRIEGQKNSEVRCGGAYPQSRRARILGGSFGFLHECPQDLFPVLQAWSRVNACDDRVFIVQDEA